ncbi:asparagine--tRNA ligase [Patescibacteria group bacterium]|nr:asparagine--tRNA ligase [Patescibacteria group bacterium]
MNKIAIAQAADFIDQKVKIQGWVYNLRSSGSIYFLQIRDGSGFMQAIISKSNVESGVWKKCEKITQESSVKLQGKISKHPKKEEYELQVSELEIIQIAEEYPISKKEHGPDFLLDNRHLWLRSNKQWAIMKVRYQVFLALTNFFDQKGYTRVDAPIFTPSACEGTTTLFGVDYFDLGKAYLSQSGQLYSEAAIRSLGKVYDFGPVFRAEKSKTRRHLTEFWMLDYEEAFLEHQDNLEVIEDCLVYVAEHILNNCQKELEILERDTGPLKKIKKPFIRMSHQEAVEKLHQLGSNIKADDDLGGDDETILTKEFDQPILIDKYPAKVKAFYMKRDPQDESRALCVDCLAPEGYGEIVGGSQREDDYQILLKRLKEHKLAKKDFDWYLDLRKYGSVPSSGAGIGLERLVGWLCGTHHVRETIPFPRMITRLRP